MTRRLQNWLKSYAVYTGNLESPTGFHFWTGVSTLAGALRRKVWIDMKRFQWTPNFFIVLVGPPGVAAKSTSISVGMSLLTLVPSVKFGPESMTWQALAKDLEAAIEYVKYSKPDGTEGITKMSCLTISISELGTFLRLDDEQLMSFLIRMWDGQNDIFRHRTKQSGNVEVENPWLNFIGATTPSWLRENFPESMVGGGLTSRMVFVYGETKRSLIPYPDEVIPDVKLQQLHTDLIHDLIEISKLSGPFVLTDFARDWGRGWYKDHNNPDLRSQHLISERFGGYLARKQTHLHKLAIILSASQRDDRRIEAKDLEEAEEIMKDVEKDMTRVFDYIGCVDQRSYINQIVDVVKFYGTLTDQGLWTRCMNQMTRHDYQEAVKAAHKAGLVIIQTGANGQMGISVPQKGTKSP
jgi:hypothetical protein